VSHAPKSVFRSEQNNASTLHEQHAQIAVPALADATEVFFDCESKLTSFCLWLLTRDTITKDVTLFSCVMQLPTRMLRRERERLAAGAKSDFLSVSIVSIYFVARRRAII
jgi:hypothetical protein